MKLRRLSSFLVAIVLCLPLFSFAASKLVIITNGSEVNTEYKLIDGTTYLPLREMSELLGIPLLYDKEFHTVSLSNAVGIVEPVENQFAIYTNKEFEFEVSYPQDWVLESEVHDGIMFISIGENNKSSSIILTAKKPRDTDWLRLFLDGFGNKLSDSEVEFGLVEARKVMTMNKGNISIHYGIEEQDKSVLLSVFNSNAKDNYIINAILSSMKF